MKPKRQKGFTLTELILIIVLLGILGVIAVPKYYDYKTKSNIAAVKGILGDMRTALILHQASLATIYDTASYPTLAELQAGGLFTDGKVPADPVRKVTLISAAYAGDGGWVYNNNAGTIYCDVAGYTSY